MSNEDEVMTDEESEKFINKEYLKLQKAIYNFMANIQFTADYSDKEIIRITKRDSNFIIEEWINA